MSINQTNIFLKIMFGGHKSFFWDPVLDVFSEFQSQSGRLYFYLVEAALFHISEFVGFKISTHHAIPNALPTKLCWLGVGITFKGLGL